MRAIDSLLKERKLYAYFDDVCPPRGTHLDVAGTIIKITIEGGPDAS